MALGTLLVPFVAAVGTLKILVALGCLAWGGVPLELDTGRIQPPPTALTAVFVLAFAASGWILLAGGRGRPPASPLGAMFLVIGSSFGNRLLVRAAVASPAAAPLLQLLAGTNVDAWLPCLAWLFARHFPASRARDQFRRLITTAVVATGLLGALLVAANLGLTLEQDWQLTIPLASLAGHALASPDPASLAPGMRILTRWLYYPLLLLLAVAIVPVVVGSRAASITDRRRTQLFMAVLSGAAAVTVLDLVLLTLWRRLSLPMPEWMVHILLPMVVYAAILSVPFATAYLVLVHHIIALRLVLRRALQYALARYSILAAGLLPYAAAAAFLYTRRDTTLRDLATGSSLVLLLASAAAAVAVLFLRDRLLNGLDRRFFREQYDARRTLGALVERSRVIRTVPELAALFTREIDRVLHVSRADFLVHPRGSDHLVDTHGSSPPLPSRSTLAVLLATTSDPLPCETANAGSPLGRLPAADRDWLAASGYQLLVPLLSSQGALLGTLALGGRRSEIAYREEDRRLLTQAAAAAALALERIDHETHSPAAPGSAADLTPGTGPPALECLRCRAICAPPAASCPSCGGTVIGAEVPCRLRDTFEFVRRIGEGGAGIVYLARDLILSRDVAIKTLPRISEEGASRLRREARMTARLTHENLALILGAEIWRGRPMLVFEFLERGTLADRLRRSGPLMVTDALALTLALAGALRAAHEAGLIHGDVKPSNIGFNGRGVPKLLDFGVARIVRACAADAAGDAAITHTATAAATLTGTVTGLAGTPGYLPPEAFGSAEPAPAFDLWALTVVLYEGLTGRNPLQGRSPVETVLLVKACSVPPVAVYRPDCPAPLAALLARGLDPSPERRHRSAAELQDALTACAGSLDLAAGH